MRPLEEWYGFRVPMSSCMGAEWIFTIFLSIMTSVVGLIEHIRLSRGACSDLDMSEGCCSIVFPICLIEDCSLLLLWLCHMRDT